jgi:hypothetical protein
MEELVVNTKQQNTDQGTAPNRRTLFFTRLQLQLNMQKEINERKISNLKNNGNSSPLYNFIMGE